jgi:hypothetical protein
MHMVDMMASGEGTESWYRGFLVRNTRGKRLSTRESSLVFNLHVIP